MVRMCELMTLACATALVAGSAASAADNTRTAKVAGEQPAQVIAPSSARQAVNNVVNNVSLFAGPFGCVNCTWVNGTFDGRDGQDSHLGGAIPCGAKSADDFFLCYGFVYDLQTINATLLTTTFPGLVKPKAELWSDCNGCPDVLLYTFENAQVTETGNSLGTAFDGRALRIVNVTWNISAGATGQPVIANQNVVLKGGIYWLSVYGQTDGLCQSMNMCDVTYWGTTSGIRGLPAKKINGTCTGVYNQFSFPPGCGANGWQSLAACCIGCTDLNFSICTRPCKILIDNGFGLHQPPFVPPAAPLVVGSTSQFAIGSNSPLDTRSADDFVVPPCQDYTVCYVEGCVLTNCPTFDGIFEIYNNNCHKPNYALHGNPRNGPFIATKIIPLNYSATLDGKVVSAYKLEFHDLSFVLAGGSQYWISVGVRYTFSLNERAFFCYNDDCGRNCLIRWNDGRVLTSTTQDLDFTDGRLGWAAVGHDFSFLVAADGNTTPGPINSNPSCAADYNKDGSVNVQDIFDYLTAWFTGCP